jgi:hypothetical protein
MNRLHHFILIFSHAYMECTETMWNGKIFYRRTVDISSQVVWC